jgi:hypothetical protein
MLINSMEFWLGLLCCYSFTATLVAFLMFMMATEDRK